MYIHNFDPVFFKIGFFEVRWYSIAYILGILIGWWLGKKIFDYRNFQENLFSDVKKFDDYITYLIISIILGGRIGYVFFYNLEYYISKPFDIMKIWEGGMSFHGALLGVIIGTLIFVKKNKLKIFFLLDIVACVSPIGLFFGRVANFINSELYGKPSEISWSVIFPKIDNVARHPSQLYEAFLEGIILFIILIFVIYKKNIKIGVCSSFFLIFYGIFRIFAENFREPDPQIGYLFNLFSMGSLLSFFMIIFGILLFIKTTNEKKII